MERLFAPDDEFMVIAAVRYCMGRMSIAPGICADWLEANWSKLSANTSSVIHRDLEREFELDDAARARGSAHKPLGMDMDRAEWERVRKLWAVEVEGG